MIILGQSGPFFSMLDEHEKKIERCNILFSTLSFFAGVAKMHARGNAGVQRAIYA